MIDLPEVFKEMEVGDSVFYPERKFAHECPELAAARVYGKETGKVFESRRWRWGIRIWRTK